MEIRSWLARLLLFGALSAGEPAIARAQSVQSVRGIVTMPDNLTRAPGVIVVAQGETGPATRALSNQRGEFSIQLPAPGRYTLRALRIGFRPSDGPTITVASGQTVEARLTLAAVAVSLQAVTVRGDDVCRTNPDSGALVARAWEEARKAIMASQLSATDAPLIAEWIEYNRTLDPTGRIVRAQRVRSTTSPTTHAFRSAPAELLAERGYVVVDSGETIFHAPDGDVLLSDSFAATHCFQVIQPAAGADTLIGVGFRPARDRRDFRDIDGTFWLDRRTAELRFLEYRYTSMPPATERAQPGGRVDFLRLGTGGWVIGRWSIRMPEVGRMAITNDPGRRRVIRAPAGGVLRAIQITGGEVTRVTRGDTVVFQGVGASLDVQLIATDAAVPAARGVVALDGTDYVATAGNDGRARATPVLAGRYEARIHTPLMDTLGVAPISQEVEVRLRARPDTVRLPSGEELLSGACRDSVRRGESLLRGVVRDTLGRVITNAAVVVSWQGRVARVGETVTDRNAWTEQTIGALSDSTGRWRACGVPREALITVRVRTDDGSDARRVTLEPDQLFGAIDLVPRRVVAAADAIPRGNRAVVELSVTDEDGALLSGVTIEVDTPDGITRTIQIGANGRALIPDVAPGRLIVRARKIGYRAGQVSATIAAGRNTVPLILSVADLPQLDTVRIVGDERKNGRLDEFETRRLNASATRSITRAEIVKRNPVNAWQMMTNVPSVKVAEQGGLVVARSMRVGSPRLMDQALCYLKVMVDGVLWPEEMPNLNNLPPPDQIHGIEVFAGPASIPVHYGGTGRGKWCGLIAVWTR